MIARSEGRGWAGRKAGMLIKGKQKGTFLSHDYVSGSILFTLSYYSYAGDYVWRKLSKRYMRSLCIISSNCKWVYNYLEIKILIKNMVEILLLKKWNSKENWEILSGHN